MATGKQLKVSTHELEIGMYVTRLDRPWTDTPFLFQGFYIRNQDEIEELRRHCQYVFVDPEHAPDSATGNRYETAGHTITNVTNLRAAHDKPRGHNRTVYVTAHPVERELPAARELYGEVGRAFKDMITKLEADGRLDVQLAKETVEPMVESVLRNPDAMIWLARMKQHDAYIYQHSVSTSIWAVAFGRHLGLDKQALYEIGLGGMLFDVGKTKLPRTLLHKHESLTPLEWHVTRNHVYYSCNLIEGATGVTTRIFAMVQSHHERYDGSGYPEGLKGNQIPTFAKIAAMVDCYDAITSPRPYARQRTPYEAVREIYTWRGTLFQPEVVEQFMQVVGVFPTGSLVELNNGAVGVVIAQNETRRLRPRIMLILDHKKRRLAEFQVLDLLNDTSSRGSGKLWIERCLEPGSYGVDPQELYL